LGYFITRPGVFGTQLGPVLRTYPTKTRSVLVEYLRGSATIGPKYEVFELGASPPIESFRHPVGAFVGRSYCPHKINIR